jgi:hypothetical protein
MADKKDEQKKDEVIVPDLNNPPEGYKKEEWLKLSEEERKGILAPEDKEEPEAKEEAAAKEAPKGEEKAKEIIQPEAFAPFYKVEYKGPTPEEVKAKSDETQAKIDALDQRYEDGDIALKEYNKERDKLRDEIAELKSDFKNATRQAEIDKSHNEQVAAQKWDWEQQTFFEQNPEYNFDKDPVLYGAIDSCVKTLAAKEENASKSGFWFLNEAKKMVDEKFKITTSKTEDKGGDGRDVPRPDLKTLSHIPSADKNQITNKQDEFSHLDNLSGLELEKEVAKLTKEQQDRFMATC